MAERMKGNVADLGCGPCVMYEGKTVGLVGVDWSAEALKQARLHYPHGVYIQADALSTGLPSGQFDTVVALGLFDYYEDWTPLRREMERLKRPGGAAMATLLNGFQGHDWTQYPHITGNWHLMTF